MINSINEMIESMINSLNSFLENNIFSKEEIRLIIRKRRYHEYELRRLDLSIETICRIIKYECALEKLRVKRKNVLDIEYHLNSDHSILSRIHYLFQRALRKFSQNLEFWWYYFDFCQSSRSINALSRAFTKCLQINPNAIEVWIRAANWEFFNNNNNEGSRKLLQRALELNSKNKNLWLAYLKFELKHLSKKTINSTYKFDEIKSFKKRLIPQLVVEKAVKQIPDNLDFLKSVVILLSSKENKHLYQIDQCLSNLNSPSVVVFRLKWLYHYHKNRTNNENIAWNSCLIDVSEVIKFNPKLINPILDYLWSQLVEINNSQIFILILHHIVIWQTQFNPEKTFLMLSVEIKTKILLKTVKSALLCLIKGKVKFYKNPEWWLLFSSFLLFQNQLNKSINHLWCGILTVRKSKNLLFNLCNISQQLLNSKQTHIIFQKIFWKRETDTEVIKKYIRWIIDNDKSKLHSSIAFISHSLPLTFSTCNFLLETFELINFSDKLILNLLEKMCLFHGNYKEIIWLSLIHFHESRGGTEKVSDIYVRALIRLKESKRFFIKIGKNN